MNKWKGEDGMSELSENIQAMIENIEGYCILLVQSRTEEEKQFREGLKSAFTAVITAMYALYDLPQYADVKEDKIYWEKQLQRICEALDSEDVFFKTDVLKNETEENFKLFLNMIQ